MRISIRRFETRVPHRVTHASERGLATAPQATGETYEASQKAGGMKVLA